MAHLPHSCSEWLWYSNSIDGQVSVEVEADADVIEDNTDGMVEHVCHGTLQKVDCN